MPNIINWKTGFEIELIAPKGSSREQLANHISGLHGGKVERFFHSESEPSKVEGSPIFQNLALGFRAIDLEGNWIASFVDDLTLQADLESKTPAKEGWFRILSDENRLIRLMLQQCDPETPPLQWLDPMARLFGTETEVNDDGMIRVYDDQKTSVAICAPLPGERERACEIITAPLEHGHEERLSALLDTAKSLGFTIPKEGATHIHFDAAALCSAHAIANLVTVLDRFGSDLKSLIGVNKNCRRLGDWPRTLLDLVKKEEFLAAHWPEAREMLSDTKLSKYCDFNLINIVNADTSKHSVEIRILPATLSAKTILHSTILFEAILRWCSEPDSKPNHVPNHFSIFLDFLMLDEGEKSRWRPAM